MSGLPTEEDSPVAALSAAATAQGSPDAPQGAALSHWLQLMLAEIARKREELDSARAEAARRALEATQQKIAEREAHAVRHGRPRER